MYPILAFAAIEAAPLDLPLWSAIPFLLTLLSIALLPLLAREFWEFHRWQAVVMAVFALPVAAYLIYLGPFTDGQSTATLFHAIQEYLAFLCMLAALYVVAGGIAIDADFAPTPLVNTLILATGSILANFIGTTGASMLLIRPMLRINRGRQRLTHVPVFFIFLVSNLGGLLTPLGDPPLFLGFLNGVDFFWTLRLWPVWATANGCVLAIFFTWDWLAGPTREELAALSSSSEASPTEPRRRRLRVRGVGNFAFLAGILVAVLLQPRLPRGVAALSMVILLLLSVLTTPRDVRRANEFTWGPIVEVAVLFAGIFVTMVPALELLKLRGPELGIDQPWQYFWLTGGLSSFLDNAPTYMTFATLAAAPHDLAWLAQNKPALLAAVSCGAVLMGANTYIANGPNFMVKAITEHAGVPTPSFFGFMVYAVPVLMPIYLLVTWLFFWPHVG